MKIANHDGPIVVSEVGNDKWGSTYGGSSETLWGLCTCGAGEPASILLCGKGGKAWGEIPWVDGAWQTNTTAYTITTPEGEELTP